MSKKSLFLINYLQFWEKLMREVYFQKMKTRSQQQSPLSIINHVILVLGVKALLHLTSSWGNGFGLLLGLEPRWWLLSPLYTIREHDE